MLTNQTETKHKQAVADFFSETAKFWKIVYDNESKNIDLFNQYFMSRRRALVLRLLDTYARECAVKVLDAGCGAGAITQELVKRGHSVTAVDISSEMLKETEKCAKQYGESRIQCFQRDIGDLSFKDNSFDAAVCIGVLQYLHNDEKGIREIIRVVKPEGYVIISLPNVLRINVLADPYYLSRALMYIRYKLFRAKRTLNPDDFSSNITFQNKRYYYNQLDSVFRENGFCKADVLSVGYGPLTFMRKEILPQKLSLRLSDYLDRLSSRTGFRWIKVFANRWVISFKKGG